MLNNKAKDNKNPYHQVSLPKPINPAYNTNSTRCMSVSKPDLTKTPLLTPIPIKPMVPPKQLTVSLRLVSTTSGRATTKASCEGSWATARPGSSQRTAPRLSST